MVTTISPELLRQHLQDDTAVTLIDTRPTSSFEEWHIPGARNHPFTADDELDPESLNAEFDLADAELLVTICGKGVSSYAFAEAMEESGLEEIAVVQDGMEGWSRLYELAAVPTVATNLEIFQVQRVAKGCLGYVIGSPTAAEAVIVDPSRHTDEYRRIAEDDAMEITRVIDTHLHADHISGGRALAEETGATYHLPATVQERDVDVDHTPLERNEVFTVGDIDLKAIATPGHTSESISLLVGAEAVLTADTLFVDGVGRTELQYGEESAEAGARELYRSIHGSILSLPDAVSILPGHFAVDEPEAIDRVGHPIRSTVGEARTDLPILQADVDEFVERITGAELTQPPNYERVLAINAGREALDDAQAATALELGPNRCAAAAD